MKKIIKKSAIISLCFCMMAGMTVSASAYRSVSFDPQQIVNENSYSGHPSIHGYTLTQNYTTDQSQQIRLNAYTWSNPVAGTPVTTWKNDNSPAQIWGWYELYGGQSLGSHSNPQLVVQITRTSSQPEVTLEYLVGNRYGDVILNRTYDNKKFYVVPRYIHSQNMYLTAVGSLPGSNGGTYLRWTPSGSDFYLYDVSWNMYAYDY